MSILSHHNQKLMLQIYGLCINMITSAIHQLSQQTLAVRQLSWYDLHETKNGGGGGIHKNRIVCKANNQVCYLLKGL